MRSTIIPAQITTVEDKIAGSLSLSQILILIVPVLLTAIIYVLFLPSMKLAPYKLVLILIVTATCGLLAMRVKDKIVAQWLGVLLAYQLRPRYFLYNKNDLSFRQIDMPTIKAGKTFAKQKVKKPIDNKAAEIELSQLVKLENLISSGKVAFHYQFNKK